MVKKKYNARGGDYITLILGGLHGLWVLNGLNLLAKFLEDV